MIRAAIKAPLLTLLIFTAIGILATLTLVRLPRRRARMILYRMCMALTGMRVHHEGTLAPSPLMLVSNHLSYLDVILLGSLEDIAFTPKSDVRAWPVIGALVALFGAVFVERNPRKAKDVQAQVHTALISGRPLSIFPEGTTNDGRSLLPFKPSLFSLATLEPNLTIQPVSVRYEKLNGKPLEGAAWDNVAWYGDFDFFPHLWQFLKQSSLDATIVFHPPLLMDENMDRKTLASMAYERVHSGLNFPPMMPSHEHAA